MTRSTLPTICPYRACALRIQRGAIAFTFQKPGCQVNPPLATGPGAPSIEGKCLPAPGVEQGCARPGDPGIIQGVKDGHTTTATAFPGI